MNEREVVSGMVVFAAVVEGGSFAAAARKTRLTASAVSKLVSRLESGLDVRLLRRTTRSMTLTDAGQTFYERSLGVLEDLRSVEQEVASHGTEPRGLVRVSAPLLLGQTRVMPILLAFMKRVQAVSVDLDLTDRPVDMVGERVDVAVRITASPPLSFVARRVGTLRRVLCASPGYLRKRRLPRVPEELDDHACLLLSGPSAPTHWELESPSGDGPPTRVGLAPRLRVSNTLSLYEAALDGLGIAELPLYLVAEDLRVGRLKRVLERFEPSERGVYVIYPPTRFTLLRVRELTNHLVTELGKAL